jgi:ribosome-binding factor A
MKVSTNRKKEQIKVKLSTILSKSSSNPKFAGVTIVDVKLSPDSSTALVSFSVFGTKIPLEEITQALNAAGGFFQSKLSATLRSRNTPRLTFRFDKGFDHANRIDEILSQIEIKEEEENE